MKKNIQTILLLSAIFFVTLSADAQPDRIGYVVTDSVKNGVKWNYLRQINLNTGNFGNMLVRLLSSNDTPANGNTALTNGVAAIAHDKKNKRIYFTAMLTDKLSYADLRTMTVHVAKNNFTGLMPKAADQSNIITRMVIGDDDFGYALTNDGKHLIRFSTRNNPVVTDLGSLVDAPGNNANSVHNSCSSYGGDLIASENDNVLYLVTIRNHVFKINTRTRLAKFMGTISGLPQTFSTTGTAVDQTEMKVVIVSSVDSSDVYSVNINSLAATGLNVNRVFFSSDLGGSNMLKNRRDNDDDDDDDDDDHRFITINSLTNDNIRLYPNPVTGNEFKIQFSDTNPGSYTVELIDVKGQVVTTRVVATGGKNSVVFVSIPSHTARGFFIVRIIDKNNKTVFSEKIVLQ